MHIHFKVRINGKEFTSQLSFDDALSMEVYAASPYSRKGQGFLMNAPDAIYPNGGD